MIFIGNELSPEQSSEVSRQLRFASLVSKKGNRLSIRTAQDNFQKIVTKAGPFSIEKVTPHSMRHAFATHASEFYN
ncbi:MAG: tyrosine-type recombinase/integrase [Desulfobulbaceae bacterium]|nr:tyrosine-type recombinase/integrase [Desulfobulbaceae bacterium]